MTPVRAGLIERLTWLRDIFAQFGDLPAVADLDEAIALAVDAANTPAVIDHGARNLARDPWAHKR